MVPGLIDLHVYFHSDGSSLLYAYQGGRPRHRDLPRPWHPERLVIPVGGSRFDGASLAEAMQQPANTEETWSSSETEVRLRYMVPKRRIVSIERLDP
ncbi:MAG: hypothetical protein AAGA48_09365 [Myxococcota bacterium]